MSKSFSLSLFVIALVSASLIADTRMVIHIDDFETTNEYNAMSFFGFEIIFDGDLQPGVIENPPILYLEYHLVAHLPEPTPSGMALFHLTRIMDGDEFYQQGSSLTFEIAEDAEMLDGIQFNELVDGLVLNAVEIGTGQYHPPIVELYSDGTGLIQNANNFGGINGETGMMVDVDFGEEFITSLAFDAENYRLTPPMLGDLNLDCQVNLLDVQPFVNALTNDFYDENADMNGDGDDNLLDVIFFVQAVVSS